MQSRRDPRIPAHPGLPWPIPGPMGLYSGLEAWLLLHPKTSTHHPSPKDLRDKAGMTHIWLCSGGGKHATADPAHRYYRIPLSLVSTSRPAP